MAFFAPFLALCGALGHDDGLGDQIVDTKGAGGSGTFGRFAALVVRESGAGGALPDTLVIEGTGPEGKLSEVALTNLFSMHVAIINASKQLIWQRYNVMMTASTIVLGFNLTADPSHGTRPFATVVGLSICGFWGVMTVGGWIHMLHRTAVAGRFGWKGLAPSLNPLDPQYVPMAPMRLEKDWTFIISLLVIILMAVAHLLAGFGLSWKKL